MKEYITKKQLLLSGCLVIVFIAMQGCTCCAYFNHAWNMQEAYKEASELREVRLDSIQNDSALRTGTEADLYDRVIEKGSRIVERFPKNENQVPKAVFMMAEAFRHKNEWSKAIEKYDELERYFPTYDSMPKAEYERAYCLYKNNEFALARFSTERILEQGESHSHYLPALELMSILQEKDDLLGDAIASLEAVLASNFGTPWIRAKARLRLANLYFTQNSFVKAREHYTNKELFILPIPERYHAQSSAAECLVATNDSSKTENKETNANEAAKEYKALADSVVFKDKKTFSLVRQGEILLSINDKTGIDILESTAKSTPRTEIASRAYFSIGDYMQKNKNYPTAISQYDLSFQSKQASNWGRESYKRKQALTKLLALKDTVNTLQKEEKPFFPQEFQIAELFLLKLSETDSALALLAKMDSTLTDSSLIVRAAYTRAFIYDEFKKDTSKAYPIYRKIIENFPKTNYAKQAQTNMGLQVTAKTNEDLAREDFLKAEEAWLYTQKIPVENIAEIDSAYKNTIALYDSVITNFPETETNLQAMYAKATILADELGEIDSARTIFVKLSKEHGRTVYGKAAYNRISGKLSLSMNELVSLRKRVENLESSVKQQSEKYFKESNKKQNEDPPDIKTTEDEILLNDYNTLYDFK